MLYLVVNSENSLLEPQKNAADDDALSRLGSKQLQPVHTPLCSLVTLCGPLRFFRYACFARGCCSVCDWPANTWQNRCVPRNTHKYIMILHCPSTCPHDSSCHIPYWMIAAFRNAGATGTNHLGDIRLPTGWMPPLISQEKACILWEGFQPFARHPHQQKARRFRRTYYITTSFYY